MSGPHDLLVRFTFGQPERAAAELRAILPPHVVSQVDWTTLRREPSSVVDPELRETESDLLFSARLSSGRPFPNGADDLGVVYHYLQRVADQEAWSAAVGMLHSALGAQRAEELMTTWFEEHYPHRVEQWRQEAWSKGVAEGKAQGQAEGKAEAKAEGLLRVLAARSIHVDDQSRQRILSCQDLATLDRWFDQALRATSLTEVLSSSSY